MTLQPKKPASASLPAAAVAKKPAAVVTSSAKPATKAGGSASAGSLDTFKYKHTPEDAESLAVDLLPASIMSDLADANWKTRLASLEEMSGWIEGEIQSLDAEVVVRALAKKGWGEKNFQVSFDILRLCMYHFHLLFSGFCQALCQFGAD